jgi:hypothetical protein
MRSFMAFENEEDSFSINQMQVCNKETHITLDGILQITKDKEGLRVARELKRVIDASIDILKGKDIPDRIDAPLDEPHCPKI